MELRIITSRPLGECFALEGVTGCIALHPAGGRELLVSDRERAARRIRPASTFKILNALIALEERVVSERDVVPWDGSDTFNDASRRPLDIRAAFQASAVWFFQRLAREIEPRIYARYLSECHYGNGQCGAGDGAFWLDGTLLISPVEQLRFLRRLADGALPFRAEVIAAVRDFMVLDTDGWTVLRAKTGWSGDPPEPIGWFAGDRGHPGGTDVFATVIDMPDIHSAPLRRAVTERCLGFVDRSLT